MPLSKERRFGTDGIRGPVDTTMNPLFVTKLGWAAGTILLEEGISRVLIGKDTRISGYMLESALQAGFIASGIDVVLLGPLPTPGVSFLANSNKQAGVVISASHNLFEDNGIKLFGSDGFHHLLKQHCTILEHRHFYLKNSIHIFCWPPTRLAPFLPSQVYP